MGTASNVLVSATLGTIAAMALTTLAVVRAGNQRNQDSKDQAPKEVYERAPRSYYKPSNEADVDTYDYASNETVYGKLLRGELKLRLLLETKDWIAFEDISPRAPLHGLVIPKKRINSVLDLDATHLPMVRELQAIAHGLLQDKMPLAYKRGDYKLCFHIPPLNSVDHLHLHVLAPCSEMSSLAFHGEFHTKSDNAHHRTIRWNIALEDVMARLEKGQPPTPYSKDYRWSTTLYETISSLGTVSFPGSSTTTVTKSESSEQ